MSSIGKFAKSLILEGLYTNQQILDAVKAHFPEAKTSIACIAWYKSDLKKKKVVSDQPFQDWKKANNLDDAALRAEFALWQAAQVEEPKAEEPKVEEPKVEAPKVEEKKSKKAAEVK